MSSGDTELLITDKPLPTKKTEAIVLFLGSYNARILMLPREPES